MAGAGSKNALSIAPTINTGAIVDDFQLGQWTEVGSGTVLKHGSMGDWSYITKDCHVVWSTIGKMCSIANSTRIIPATTLHGARCSTTRFIALKHTV